jgi:hypothetical protein
MRTRRQLSVRGLLVIVFLCCVALGLYRYLTQEGRAIAIIRKRGGNVAIRSDDFGTNYKEVSFLGSQRPLDLEVVLELSNVRSLIVSGSSVRKDSWQSVAKISTLVQLYANSSSLTDSDLSHLKKCTELRVLNIRDTEVSGTRFTDHGLRHIPRLQQLVALDLGSTRC